MAPRLCEGETARQNPISAARTTDFGRKNSRVRNPDQFTQSARRLLTSEPATVSCELWISRSTLRAVLASCQQIRRWPGAAGLFRLRPGSRKKIRHRPTRVARVIDDPQVEISVVWAPTPSAATAIDKVVFTKVARVTDEMWPGIKVVPAMSAGASDNVYWRRAGLETFGVCGTFTDTTDIRAHGKDERVAVDAFYHSLEFSYRLMKSLSTR